MQIAVTINSAATTQGNANAEPLKLRKRIGSTTFVVAVHFNRTDRETLQDKILRLIESEVRNSA